MRIALGQILQETNTFSPIPTTLETFKRYYVHKGDEVLTGFETNAWRSPASCRCCATPMSRWCR